MEINLTPAQWEELKILCRQGQRAEMAFSGPCKIEQGDISIEVKEAATDIILSD